MGSRTMEFNDFSVRRGDLIIAQGEPYRILEANTDLIFLISMNNPTLLKLDSTDFLKTALNENYTKAESAGRDRVTINRSSLAEASRRSTAFETVLSDNYPAWHRIVGRNGKKNVLETCSKELNISERRCRLLFMRYLRSGRDVYSMLDKRALKPYGTNRITDNRILALRSEKEKILDEALAEFKRSLSITSAYHAILRRHYMAPVYEDGTLRYALTVPEDERISYYQVWNYIGNHLGDRTIKEYIKGEKDYRNNKRPLRGSARYGLPTIGHTFLLDECELDVYIVSESDPNQVIGKPIMYCAVDPFADMIVGVSVGLQNNSYSGFCDLMISMLEPHENQTRTVGIHCSDEDFPSMILPKELRADHGSEYESKFLATAMNELGIKESLVPVAAGSYKGLVENVFQRIQHVFRSQLYDSGYIMKTHDGPDKARENACLTLKDVRMLVYRIVLDLNSTPLPGYSLTRDMMESGVDGSPKSIWKYEINRCGNPVNIGKHNRQRILFALLRHDKSRRFKVTRAGIEYVGHSLRYFVDEDWFLDMISNPDAKPDIRYNDLLVDSVYVLYQKQLHEVPLAMRREELDSFCGMSWYDYDELYRFSRITRDHERTLERKLNTEMTIESSKRLAKSLRADERNRLSEIKNHRKSELSKLSSDPGEARNRLLNGSDNSPNDETLLEYTQPPSSIPVRRISQKELLLMLEDEEN